MERAEWTSSLGRLTRVMVSGESLCNEVAMKQVYLSPDIPLASP